MLEYDKKEPVTDERGQAVTRWDGRTTRVHPVTGEEVPDEAARVLLYEYTNTKRTGWPNAEFLVGNPPYIGNKRMKPALGDGYVEALRAAYPEVPGSADLVMYWWDRAARMLSAGQAKRFGFITTNSITQPFNRKVLQAAISSGSRIAFAIPDHPWVDSENGAAVRVAMTVADTECAPGSLAIVISELETDEEERDVALAVRTATIHADLSGGTNLSAFVPLKSNVGIAFTGMYPLGQGFVLMPDEVEKATGGREEELAFVRPFFIARDLTQVCRKACIIDFYPLPQVEALALAPNLFQWVLDRVKPQRDQDKVAERRRNWWLFTRPIPSLRKALEGLSRYILVPRTAKHFTFQFQPSNSIPDTSVVAIASDDALLLALLSSRPHVVWATTVGGRLGYGNDTRYQHASTFNPYPFPAIGGELETRIRGLGELLDAHRKRQQAENPNLTFTGMYNVLEKLRTGDTLTEREKLVHEQGLVSILKQIHDDIDSAVFEAYGWPMSLTNEELLERIVALNAERAAEEAGGIIRWLRPEFQKPEGPGAAAQATLEMEGAEEEAVAASDQPRAKLPWPKTLTEQVQAVRNVLATSGAPTTADQIAKRFLRARVDRVQELLDTLASLGQARELPDGRFAPPPAMAATR